MARMIPNYCYTKSPGEEVLFKLLRDSQETSDWVIFHSLHIARHNTKPEGEADFVVVIPSVGIIFIEVKAYQTIRRVKGVWLFGPNQEERESPFVQVATAMHSLRRDLIDKAPFTKQIAFLDFCWFTEIPFTMESVEWHQWQVLDQSDLENPAQQLLKRVKAGVQHLRETVSPKVGTQDALTPLQINQIIDVLRPDFDFALSEKQVRAGRAHELRNFMEEQFDALDTCDSMEKVVFTGPAGTGKTLLAVELAKRKSTLGLKVKFICFNKLLSQEISAQLQKYEVEVMTIDSLALRIARTNNKVLGTDAGLHAIQQFGYENLEVPDNERVDYLIIDESQDIFKQSQLALLNNLLIGGLREGSWVAFGDFAYQRLYNGEDSLSYVKENYGSFPLASLSKNCRNTLQIGSFVESFLKDAPKWKSFRRQGDYPLPELISVSPTDEISRKIDESIQSFKADKYSLDDIVILTPSSLDSPGLIFNESSYSAKFTEYVPDLSGKIGFSTIAKFKGLDAPCIIAMDLEEMAKWPQIKEYLYVLLTRAQDRIHILVNDKSRQMLSEILGA